MTQSDIKFSNLQHIKELVSFSEKWLHTFHTCSCWQLDEKLEKKATATTARVKLNNRDRNYINSSDSILETSPQSNTEGFSESVSAKLLSVHVANSYSFVLRALEYAVGTLHLLITDKQTQCVECVNDAQNLPHDTNAWHKVEWNELHTVKGVLLYYQAMWHGSHHATSSLATMKEQGIWQRQSTKAASALLLECMSLSPHYLYRQLLANGDLQNEKENYKSLPYRTSPDNMFAHKRANTREDEHHVKNMQNESVGIYKASKLTRFERPYLIDNNWDEIDYPSLARGQIKELMTWITSENALSDDDSGTDDSDNDNGFISSEEKSNRKKGRAAMAETLFVNHSNRTYEVQRRQERESTNSQKLRSEMEKKHSPQRNEIKMRKNENNHSGQSVNVSNSNENLNHGFASKENTAFAQTEIHSNEKSSNGSISNNNNNNEDKQEYTYMDDDNDNDEDDVDLYDEDDYLFEKQERSDEEVEKHLRSVHALLISASLQVSNAKGIPFDAEVAKGLILMALRRLRYTCDVTFTEHVINKAKSFGLDINEWPIRGLYRTVTSFQWDRDELKKLESEVELAQIACHVPHLRKRFHVRESDNVISDNSAISRNANRIAVMTLPKQKVYKLLQKALLSLSYINMLDRETSLQATSYAMLSLRLSKSVYLQGVARAQRTWAAVIQHSVQSANNYLDKLRHDSFGFDSYDTFVVKAASSREWKRIVISLDVNSLLRRAIAWEERHQEWVSERLFRARLAQLRKQTYYSNYDSLHNVVDLATLQRLIHDSAVFHLTLPSFIESGLIRQETLVFLVSNVQMLTSRSYTDLNNDHFDRNLSDLKEANVSYKGSVDTVTNAAIHNTLNITINDSSEQRKYTELKREQETFTTITNNYEENNKNMYIKFYMSLMEEMLMDVYNINLSKVHNDLRLKQSTNAHEITREQLHMHVNLQLLLSALSLWKESKHTPHIIDNTRVSEHVSDAFYLMCALLRSYELQMHNTTELPMSVIQSMRWLALNEFQSIIFAEQTFLPKENDSVTSYCNRLSRFVQKYLHTTHGLLQRVEHGLMSDDEPTGVSHGMNRFIDNNPLIHRTLMLLRNAQQTHIERGELSTLLHISDLDAYLDDKQLTFLNRMKHKLFNLLYYYFTETTDEQMLRELGLLLLPPLSHSSEPSSVKPGRSSKWRTSSVPYFYMDAKDKVPSANFINFYLDQCSISSTFRKFAIATQLTSLALQSGRPQAFSFIMHEALASRENTLNIEVVTHNPTTSNNCYSKSTLSRVNCEMEKMWQTHKTIRRKNCNANKFLVNIADYLANDVWGMITASAWREEHFAAQWHHEKTRQRMEHLPFSLDRHTPFHYSSSEVRQELLTYIDRWRARCLLLRNSFIMSKSNGNRYDSNSITDSHSSVSCSNDRCNDSSARSDRRGIGTHIKTETRIKRRNLDRSSTKEVSGAAGEGDLPMNSDCCLNDACSSALEILSRCTSYLWFIAWENYVTNTRKTINANNSITMSPSPFDGMHFPAGSLECGIDLHTYLTLLDENQKCTVSDNAMTHFLSIKKLRLTLLNTLEDLTSRLRYYYKLTLEKPLTLLQSSVKDLDILTPSRNSDSNNKRRSGKNRKSIESKSLGSDVDSSKEKANNSLHNHDDGHITFLVEPWNQITSEEYTMSTLVNGEGVHFNQRLHRLSGVRWALYVLRMYERAKKWWLNVHRLFANEVVEAELSAAVKKKHVNMLNELFVMHHERAEFPSTSSLHYQREITFVLALKRLTS